ncbi:hypothetical protein BT93_H0867 [Corymbia citriodora subsp. variegata]|nr:hypothetical protein BT93_H0867 [Corymbia citriodora subsp. variegata]
MLVCTQISSPSSSLIILALFPSFFSSAQTSFLLFFLFSICFSFSSSSLSVFLLSRPFVLEKKNQREMSIDSAISIAWDVLKSVVAPIKRQFGYVISSKRHAQDLQKEVEDLAHEVDGVHNLIEEARNNLRNVYDRVTECHASAEKALKEARDLLSDFQGASKPCCYGTLPDPKCRYQFSKKAKDKIEVIQRLTQQCGGFKELNIFRNPALVDNDIFESRDSVVQDIVDALADDSNSVVGVHGMGGVGKSTLLIDVERRIRKEKSFDWVAKADVSENQDIRRIQGEIAHALDLDIKDVESVNSRAGLLQKRLENDARGKKKVLIILDNLWKGLDLKSVGIPCGHDNKVIGCKLLLTSRFQDVLQREMSSDRDFRLDELKEEEARSLFETTVGDKVHDDPFKSSVDEALRKCAGLPFLIITMAKLFKKANFSQWEDALKQIKMFTNKGISERINKMLQLSYDYLEGEKGKEAKLLLRLCVVYGVSKPSLENLVRYGVGLRLFRENSCMKDARNRLISLIQTLQASSLLLVDDEDADGFKIHDLVRRFVASVTSRDDPLLVLKDNDKSVTVFPKERLKSCTAACFPYIDMKELPEELDCTEMQIFLLFTNNESRKVPNSYFNSMRKLMVLHLSQVRLTCSPSPFQFLENLHTLCLDGCSLEDVAMIGELKGLHILSFVNSKIQRLPKEIGQLVELRLLELNYCSRLKIIEPGVLGNLMKLEELYMENSFDQWNAVEQTPPTNAKLIELNNMKNLYTLHVSILNPSALPEDLNVKKLTKYKIKIGDVLRWTSCKGSSTLKLKLDPTNDILQKGCIQTLLGKIDNLSLDGLDGIEQSICSLSQEGFQKLKHLQVENSPSICYVQSPSHTDFTMLESLLLKNLINLEKICNNSISSKSFGALKVLRVESCGKMEVLFPLSLLKELPRLEEIRAIECPLMREIVEVDDCGKVELRNLRKLELRDLSNINNFFTARNAPSSSTSKDQVDTQVAFFSGQQVSIPSLESLTMVGLPNLKEIWADESLLVLSNLQFLEVSSCKSLSKVINSRSLVKLHELHILTVRDCVLVQEIFCLDEVAADANIETLSKLNTICIEKLPNLRCIWDENPCGIVRFHNLKKLQVYGCNNLRYLFFPSMVQSLAQLRELEVWDCEKMEAIIMEEEGLRVETLETLVFPMLTRLQFVRLESLACFSHIKCTPEAQDEDCVRSCSTVLFNQEVAFPSLETLYISDMDNIEVLWDDQLVVRSFHKLKSLEVQRCNKLLNIVPSRILGWLKSLESLYVRSCGSLEVVFKLQPLNPLDGHPIAHFPLKKLKLYELPKLKCVWDKELYRQVKFQSLCYVSVRNCKSLASLFPASVAKDLIQLEELEIDECGIVELIAKEEGLVPRFDFSRLTSLKLNDLIELKCIYTGTHALRWPALKTLEVRGCNKVEILASQLENETPLHKQPLFLIEKVAFMSLETIYLSGMANIEILWDNQVVAESFHKLKSLSVYECNKLVSIVPSSILGWLRSLESLEVGSCGSLEVVFKHQPLSPLDGHPVAHFPLKKLKLNGLPELKCVWDEKLHNQDKFQRLHSITIFKCKSLDSLFLASVAMHLTQLEELEIYECGIVELIENEGLVRRDVFPMLTSLKLKHLIELKCIYKGTHVLRWLALKTLEIHGCDKVEIFASQPKNEMPLHKQPLFLIEKGAFPNLQELILDLSGWMEIWHGHFHDGEFFCKLRVLELHHFLKEFAISTCRFVHSLANLEKLVVCNSYRERSSINIEAIAGPSHELEVILPSSFQHLKTLEMSHCDGLSPYVILPFSRFFQRLKTLDMSFCDGLSNIFTPTIARNLVELTKLRISNCKMLTEVISDEEGEEGLVVAFNQLKYMELDGLTRLRCFSSIKYPLMFPLLEDVKVSGCLGMKFFSSGPIEAPKLESVQVSTEACFWKENLNITIQNMFEEMEMVARVEFMQLSEFPELMGKWHGELNPIKLSWQFKSLMVDKCPSLIDAIPSKLMHVLDHMTRLQVCDCKSLEEIFDLEGLEVVKSIRVLPSLKYLALVNLPKLRRLWNNSFQAMLRFNNLDSLTLYNCKNLRYAFTPSMAQCVANLSWMEINRCGQMEGVITEEEGQGSTIEKITFPHLRSVELKCLTNLTNFLLGKNHMMDCPRMSYLIIAHCPKMRSLTGQSLMEIDHRTPSLFTPQVQFPQLTMMDLSHMDSLSKIWTDSPQDTLTFEHLWKVKVENCKSLENLFPHWVATSLTHLEYLQVESCGLEEIVTSGDDTSNSNTAQFLFPQLTSLVFDDMPQLKSLCPNLPTLNWSLLKGLRVTHCDKLNMLPFVASMNKWAQKGDQHGLSGHEAHFSFERGIPTLERLLLVEKDIQMIQNGKFSDDFFGKPKALTLACFHNENAVFPSIFLLQRFKNLQSLEVFCSSFEDIFPDEGLVDEGKRPVLENLKELKLNKLHNLKRVWREGYLVAKILQSIDKFEVWDCPNLTTLFPAVTFFQNLTELVVKNSSGLMHLVTVSAITNLVHLTNMTIIKCERMKEVVANNENGEEKVISLGKLRSLTLQHLPSLECFSSTTSCIFRFPSLFRIEVEECPKMKIFSKDCSDTVGKGTGRVISTQQYKS